MADSPAPDSTPPKRTRRRRVLAIAGVIAAGAIVFVVLYFEPHTAFIDDKVSETLPGLDVALSAAESTSTTATTASKPTDPATPSSPPALTETPATGTPATGTPATATTAVATLDPTPAATAAAPPANSLQGGRDAAVATGQPVIVSTAAFISGEHDTSGTALVVALPDGSIVVRFEDLDTSNGPDLRVVLSTDTASDAWKYSGRHVLDELKGNLGDQNYTIPADVDLAGFKSVVVWCERFSVAFGAAAIDVVA